MLYFDESMPIQTLSRPIDGPVSYFASTFTQDSDLACIAESPESDMSSGHVSEPQISSRFSSPGSSPPSSKEDPQYSHRTQTSVSTLASDNTECSPSATISPTDSSTNSEITPGTSPDTPASMHSMSFLALRAPREVKGDATHASDYEFCRPAPPAKRARNLKNLAVNTSSAFAPNRKATTASFPIEVLPENDSPAISSPAFVKPLPTPKRKPSNLGLTLMTPATGTFSTAQPFNIIPPTPNLVRPTTLRHFQSSPALPTFASIRLQESTINSLRSPLARLHPSGVSEIPLERDEIQQDIQNFDESESRGNSPNAYPNGPICIYEPNVYLYLEPSAKEASAFDVVFNVASEVKNPFDSKPPAIVSPLSRSVTFAATTGFSYSENVKTNSTPLPIYHHIPWEHNTDIVPDLSNLVKEIDEYARNGKKILIHCQCGVSRSASLIVAYGLYQNPSLSVQQAYDAVKRKSQWIGPNMNLIMQLQEFRAVLMKGTRSSDSGENDYNILTKNELRTTISQNDTDVPRTAPSRPEGNFGEQALPQTPTPVSAGPSSAPSGLHSFSTSELTREPHFFPNNSDKVYFDSKGHTVSQSATALQTSTGLSQTSSVGISSIRADQERSIRPKAVSPSDLGFDLATSPRSAEFAMTPLIPSDYDDTFGLTSPRITTFNTELPHRQLHGDTAPEIRAMIQPDPDRSISQMFDQETTPTASTSPFLHQRQPEARYAAAPMNTSEKAEPDFSSMLMSPRALEFTKNPFGFVAASSAPSSTTDPTPTQHTLESDILMSPRALEFTQTPFSSSVAQSSSSPQIGPLPIQATPEPDILMSPRAVEFTVSPFNDTLEDHTTSVPNPVVESTSEVADPRSPPQKIGSPIFRNIFEVL